MSTEKPLDTLPEESGKTEPDETFDPYLDMPASSQKDQARTLEMAAREAVPFCEICGLEQPERAAPQDD